MNKITVDFSKSMGSIKPVHGVCCAPYTKAGGPEQKRIVDYFTDGNIPYCRLHDCCGGYGGSYYVDISNIFPNFDADENDPASYDFYYSDEYIGAIQNSGAEAYYRLGETIEWGSKKYRVHPPADFAKWARICEHIVMHYNEGWADGFHYNLKYWEIWNEPENPGDAWGKCMWEGTKEQFFELYKVASKHLKARFPEIKIGGYGSCGFYAITRDTIPQSFKAFVPYFTEFLDMVKQENCPLDFYTWHIYSGSVDEVVAHAKYVRETLDAKGFENTESHLNEWNIHAEGDGFKEKHTAEGAAFNGAVLSEMQNTPYFDKGMYYCFSYAGKYNGFLDQNDGSTCPPWYTFVAFGKLYAMGNAVETKAEGESVYSVAAKDDKGNYGILATNYLSKENTVSIDIKGMDGNKTARVMYVDDNRFLEEEFSFTVPAEGNITISLPEKTVAYISFE